MCDHTDHADGAHLRTVGRIPPCAAPGRYAADARSKATSGRSTKPYVRSARRPEVCETSSTAEAFEGLGFRAGHSHLAYSIVSFRQTFSPNVRLMVQSTGAFVCSQCVDDRIYRLHLLLSSTFHTADLHVQEREILPCIRPECPLRCW